MNSVVIIGYGQLGHVLARRHLQNHDAVFTVARSEYQPLSPQHTHITTDLDISLSMQLPVNIHTLYYLAPPSDNDLTDQRLKQFFATHNDLQIQKIVYISTTGVYGDQQGKWVDEQVSCKPKAERAKRRLAAEQHLQAYHQRYSVPVCILRCAAIYSAKSVSYERIAANTKPVIARKQAPYTNRIHLDDLAEVCWRASLEQNLDLTIYNVSDGQPTTTTEHAWLLADSAGLTRNQEIDIQQASQFYSPAYLSYLNESKRLDITKLKAALMNGFEFYTTEEGIKKCLAQNA